MIIFSADIHPSTSGLSHIGKAGIIFDDANSADFSTLKPYNSFHILSGIFHAQMGQSGIIRFNREQSNFEWSADGGSSFQPFSTNSADPSLQELYENFPSVIFIKPTFGDLTFIGSATNSSRFILANIVRAPISISGLNPAPETISDHDIYFSNHAQMYNISATTDDQAKTQSLGIGTLFLHTGSGVINLSIGSGIIQYTGTFNEDLPPAIDTYKAFRFPTENISDLNFNGNSVAAEASGIRILSPGLYLCTYIVNYEYGTTDTTSYCIRTRATLNESEVTPSMSYILLNNDTHDGATSKAKFLFNANAGDIFRIEGSYVGAAPVSAVVQTVDNESWVILSRIGPRRGSF